MPSECSAYQSVFDYIIATGVMVILFAMLSEVVAIIVFVVYKREKGQDVLLSNHVGVVLDE